MLPLICQPGLGERDSKRRESWTTADGVVTAPCRWRRPTPSVKLAPRVRVPGRPRRPSSDPREGTLMKNVVAILVIGLAVTLGTPNMATAQDQARQMTARVMRVNRDAQALIVRAITADGREVDSVFSVQEAAASALADLRPGETPRLTYVSVDGTF